MFGNGSSSSSKNSRGSTFKTGEHSGADQRENASKERDEEVTSPLKGPVRGSDKEGLPKDSNTNRQFFRKREVVV